MFLHFHHVMVDKTFSPEKSRLFNSQISLWKLIVLQEHKAGVSRIIRKILFFANIERYQFWNTLR